MFRLAFCTTEEKRNGFRVHGYSSAEQLQLGSSPQQHYRSLWNTMHKKMPTAISFGSQTGYTTSTSCGMCLVGTTRSTLRTSTYRKFGWTSVALSLSWTLAHTLPLSVHSTLVMCFCPGRYYENPILSQMPMANGFLYMSVCAQRLY